jgi:transposase
LSDKQQRRAAILSKVLAAEIDHRQAAERLGLSERRVRRSLAQWKEERRGTCMRRAAPRAGRTRKRPRRWQSAFKRLRLQWRLSNQSLGTIDELVKIHQPDIIAEQEQSVYTDSRFEF